MTSLLIPESPGKLTVITHKTDNSDYATKVNLLVLSEVQGGGWVLDKCLFGDRHVAEATSFLLAKSFQPGLEAAKAPQHFTGLTDYTSVPYYVSGCNA